MGADIVDILIAGKTAISVVRRLQIVPYGIGREIVKEVDVGEILPAITRHGRIVISRVKDSPAIDADAWLVRTIVTRRNGATARRGAGQSRHIAGRAIPEEGEGARRLRRGWALGRFQKMFRDEPDHRFRICGANVLGTHSRVNRCLNARMLALFRLSPLALG